MKFGAIYILIFLLGITAESMKGAVQQFSTYGSAVLVFLGFRAKIKEAGGIKQFAKKFFK